MAQAEILLHWVAVSIYALSTVAFISSLVFKKSKWEIRAVWLAGAGLLPHTLTLVLRWIVAGHGPYMRRYEVYSSDVWVLVVMFLLFQYRRPGLRVVGALVMAVAFLMIGMAVMASPEIRPLPENFRTYWLLIHIFFAKLTYGSALLGTGLALIYIYRKPLEQRWGKGGFLPLPSQVVVDELSYNLLAFSFLMNGIMIAAGSIWANNAWGSYWSWDPVETWSLVAWFIYGIYLHLRRMYGWNGSKAAWFAVGALMMLVFTLFGIGIFYYSTHSPYISGFAPTAN